MLPTEDIIDLFIDHKRSDYICREAASQRGLQQRRSLPVIIDEVLYVPNLLHQSFVESQRLQPANWPQTWGGAPTVAILKATVASNTPCPARTIQTPLGLDVRLGIPGGVCTKVTELMILWSRPDPEPVQLRRSRRRGANNSGDDRGSGVRSGGSQRKGRTGGKQDLQGAGRVQRNRRVAGKTVGPGDHIDLADRSYMPHCGNIPLQKSVGAWLGHVESASAGTGK